MRTGSKIFSQGRFNSSQQRGSQMEGEKNYSHQEKKIEHKVFYH